MNRIATASVSDRRVGFGEAAQRLKISTAIIEKDFWVCWMLGLLFGRDDWRNALVFKGGTSLSKVFGVIRRFSEDIDLSVSPEMLGISEQEVEEATSRNKRSKWMETMETACCNWAKNVMQPVLESAVSDVLGPCADGGRWLEYERDETTHSPVLYFHYPSAFEDGMSYIRRSVKLEFGSLTDQSPTGIHAVSPWIAEVLPAGMREMGCDVVALDVKRSFWEKATILHAEYHQESGKPMTVRYSRHYADLAALANSSHADAALADSNLRQRVVDWKAQFFARTAARYDLAKPDTFRLVPPDARVPELEKDYNEMREMFLGDPPKFSVILAALEVLEDQINQGA